MDTIHADIARAAQRYPDQVALWDEDREWSYRVLDEQSSALAGWLARAGVVPGSRVGILLPRSASAVIAILGVLKAGAAYVPLDSRWPERRISGAIRDSALRLLVASEGDAARATPALRVLGVDTREWAEALHPTDGAAQPAVALGAEDLAYIPYTSGSTGRPKGVCISHPAAHYFAAWGRREFALGPEDRIAAVSSFAFDMSTFDLFAGLGSGASLYIAADAAKALPTELSRFLERHRITVIFSVPTALALLASRGRLGERRLEALRTVLFAGEPFPPIQLRALIERLPAHVAFYNLYGPTETNVCTFFQVPKAPDTTDPIPIGTPLPGTRVFGIHESDAGDSGDGVVELGVAGPGVMSGYWGEDPERAAHWVPGAGSERGYRTGDLAYRRDDDNWVFCGRKDTMVKLWGYRVELGEVESCLLELAGVEQVAVVKISEGAATGLAAFVVAEPGNRVDLGAAQTHCKQHLPPYMVPRRLAQVDELPLTATGKTDRKMLARMATGTTPPDTGREPAAGVPASATTSSTAK